ncbi:uncharacterized protein LOC116297669 [Actinia tenebrosa]|uniref:Uncharacterized protein LOC116297669 n=1 Tax=Actinia tenebrosa TaxID=6105 RepID=A0A6P8I9I9_ACTTE|nr:uncharacterized protein LOC116297669 [Actinia tenebrosa]
MPVLDITSPSINYTLCLIGSYIKNCNIIKKDSLYFYEGKWYPIWPTNRKQDAFIITEDDSIIFLKWTSLGQQFTGLIFALKISCQLKGQSNDDKNTIGSYLIFKSAGSHYFNGNKPTLTPISSAPKESSSPTPQSSTTASPSQSDKGKNSSKSEDKGLIAGLTICAILVLIVIIALVVFYLRRKRNDEKPSKGAECEANPTYDLGQDRSLPVTVNGQTPTYDYPDTSSRYQPIVQNTRMRDASGKVPVYTPLNRETKNSNSPVLQMKTHDKRGLAYETVAIPIQQPAKDESGLAESPDYEDPTNPTIPNEGGLYAISAAQDGNTIDFENTAYKDPESIIKIG